MPQYALTCGKCKSEHQLAIDGPVPMFNEEKKRDWIRSACPTCGTPLFIAKFSKKSNLLFAMEELR